MTAVRRLAAILAVDVVGYSPAVRAVRRGPAIDAGEARRDAPCIAIPAPLAFRSGRHCSTSH